MSENSRHADAIRRCANRLAEQALDLRQRAAALVQQAEWLEEDARQAHLAANAIERLKIEVPR